MRAAGRRAAGRLHRHPVDRRQLRADSICVGEDIVGLGPEPAQDRRQPSLALLQLLQPTRFVVESVGVASRVAGQISRQFLELVGAVSQRAQGGIVR